MSAGSSVAETSRPSFFLSLPRQLDDVIILLSVETKTQKSSLLFHLISLQCARFSERRTDRVTSFFFFMAGKRELTKVVKLQIKGGQANPAPPIGTALGPTGVNMAAFCKEFNDKTKDRMGQPLPTLISIYSDRSYDFITKQASMTYLIKTAAKLESGSKEAHKTKVAHLTMAQLKDIAEKKMVDLNANDIDAAMWIVAGSARSMGITSDLRK